MMDRRAFVAGTLLLLAAPLEGESQQPEKVPRIGLLTLALAPSTPILEAFREGLREHGYVEGQNIALEYRFAQGRAEKLPGLAAELVKAKVEVIVIESIQAGLAAKHATQTLPIVIAIAGDPVKAGLVASLARPGGNLTGLTLFSSTTVSQDSSPLTGRVHTSHRAESGATPERGVGRAWRST